MVTFRLWRCFQSVFIQSVLVQNVPDLRVFYALRVYFFAAFPFSMKEKRHLSEVYHEFESC